MALLELRNTLSRQIQSTLNMLQQERFASDSDYLLYRLDCLVYHVNHYSPVLELDDVILTQLYVKQGRLCCHSLNIHHFSSAYSLCCVFWSAWKAFVGYFKGAFSSSFYYSWDCSAVKDVWKTKTEDPRPCGLKRRPTSLKWRPCGLKSLFFRETLYPEPTCNCSHFCSS